MRAAVEHVSTFPPGDDVSLAPQPVRCWLRGVNPEIPLVFRETCAMTNSGQS